MADRQLSLPAPRCTPGLRRVHRRAWWHESCIPGTRHSADASQCGSRGRLGGDTRSGRSGTGLRGGAARDGALGGGSAMNPMFVVWLAGLIAVAFAAYLARDVL